MSIYLTPSSVMVMPIALLGMAYLMAMGMLAVLLNKRDERWNV